MICHNIELVKIMKNLGKFEISTHCSVAEGTLRSSLPRVVLSHQRRHPWKQFFNLFCQSTRCLQSVVDSKLSSFYCFHDIFSSHSFPTCAPPSINHVNKKFQSTIQILLQVFNTRWTDGLCTEKLSRVMISI